MSQSTAVEKAAQKAPGQLTLEADLTIDTAQKLQAKFAKSLARESDIKVIADRVETIDTAGLQLLLALCRDLNSAGRAILWQSPSSNLLGSLRLLGLTEELGIVE